MKTVLAIMKQRLLFAFCMLSISHNAQNWSTLHIYLGSTTDDGCSFVIDDVAYCGTGRDAGFAYTKDSFQFHLNSESWFTASTLPDSAKRQYASDVSYSGAGYLFGGYNQNGFLNDLWKYDPIQNQWAFESTAPFSGRSGHQSIVIGDTLYIAGGRTEASPAVSEVWAYRFDTGVWEQKSAIPGDGVWRGFGVESDSIAYLGLGSDSLNLKRGEVYSYNPETDVWTEITTLQTSPLSYPSAQRIATRLFVFGGEDQFGDYSNAFRYIDLTDLTWHDLTGFSDVPRRGVMSFVSATDFFITTGITATERIDQTWVARSAVGLPSTDVLLEENRPFQSGNILITDKTWDSCKLYKVSGEVLGLNRIENGKFEIPTGVCSGIYFLEGTNSLSVSRFSIPIQRTQ